jgi:hypothetical protein
MKKRFHSLAPAIFILFLMLSACSKEDAISPIQFTPPPPTSSPTPTPPTPVPTTPPVGHMAPIAQAGNDTTIYLPFHNYTLNGIASTGSIVSYKWVVIKGPHQVGITNYDKPRAFVSGLAKVGEYEFLLTVTDNYNLSSTDTVKISVTEPNCTTDTKEIIIKDLGWSFAWIMEIDIYNLDSYLPPNSYIKNFYIKRDASDQWELIVPLDFNSTNYGLQHEWEYGNGVLVIYPGTNSTNDTPDVKIEYCN